jgi:hypothetical protein
MQKLPVKKLHGVSPCDTGERHAIDRVSRPSIWIARSPAASRLPLPPGDFGTIPRAALTSRYQFAPAVEMSVMAGDNRGCRKKILGDLYLTLIQDESVSSIRKVWLR